MVPVLEYMLLLSVLYTRSWFLFLSSCCSYLFSFLDHGSCSRVHAALIWHKHLERSFLVDLGSSKLFTTLPFKNRSLFVKTINRIFIWSLHFSHFWVVIVLYYPFGCLYKYLYEPTIFEFSLLSLFRNIIWDISAHGTFIGNFRIESNKPTQLPVDSTFR